MKTTKSVKTKSRVNSKIQSAFQLKIEQAFQQKKLINARYSRRAFARFLDIPITTLSDLMTGQSEPTASTFKKVSRRLQWDDRASESLLKDVVEARKKKTMKEETRNLKVDASILQSMLPLAIYNVCMNIALNAKPKTIARRFGCTESEARQAIEDLLIAGMVKREGDLISADRRPFVVGESARETQMKMLGYLRLVLDRGIGKLQQPHSEGAMAAKIFYFPASIERRSRIVRGLKRFFEKNMRATPENIHEELCCGAFLLFPFGDESK